MFFKIKGFIKLCEFSLRAFLEILYKRFLKAIKDPPPFFLLDIKEKAF